jgi:hypothetical protein
VDLEFFRRDVDGRECAECCCYGSIGERDRVDLEFFAAMSMVESAREMIKAPLNLKGSSAMYV